LIREPEDLPGGLELERVTIDQAPGVAVDRRPPHLRIKKLGASLSPLGLKDFFRLEGGVVRLSLNHPDETLVTMKK